MIRILKSSLFVLVACLALQTSARAQSQELNLSSTSSTLTIGNGSTSFDASASYGHFFNELFELVGSATFQLADSEGSSALTIFNLTAGPRLNFGGDLQNAFYAGAQVGFITVDAGGLSATEFLGVVEAGRRIQLGSSAVSWTPEVALILIGDQDPTFAAIPLSFSYLF